MKLDRDCILIFFCEVTHPKKLFATFHLKGCLRERSCDPCRRNRSCMRFESEDEFTQGIK
jgi:hypothetical protein